MKKNKIHIIIIYCYFLLFPSSLVTAQHVLNGSFEINKVPCRYVVGKISNVFKDLKIDYVDYLPKDTIGGYSVGTIFKDTLQTQTTSSYREYTDTLSTSWYYVPKTLYLETPLNVPDGKTYLIIESMNNGTRTGYSKINKVVLLLSEALIINKIYSIHLTIGVYNGFYNFSSKFPVILSLSKNNKKVEREIDSFFVKDTAGYRDYAVSFIADDTYKYIYLYLSQGDDKKHAFNYTMIDNIRLDSCVNLLPTHYIGCANFPELLKPTLKSKSYVWSTGDTTPTISVSAIGNYRSYAYDSLGCVNVDSFVVTYDVTPGSITNIQLCSGTTQTLKATPATAVEVFKWNTGDTTASISTNKGGTYWVNRGPIYCFITDSFYVTEITSPSTQNQDTVFCTNNSIIIGKTDAQKYVWNTTEQTPQISINKPGLYWVIKTNPPCQTTDTFNITENPLPVIKSLQDTSNCFSQIAKIALDAGQFKSYLWKPINETSQIIYSSMAQTFLLQVTDNNDCTTSKQITVTENCPEQLFIPNAFSPNEDGVNDVFTITTTELESFEMTIFNRWGEQVFNSQNYLQGWDGKNAPNEVYVVQITYKLKGKPTETIKQNVTLMR